MWDLRCRGQEGEKIYICDFVEATRMQALCVSFVQITQQNKGESVCMSVFKG